MIIQHKFSSLKQGYLEFQAKFAKNLPGKEVLHQSLLNLPVTNAINCDQTKITKKYSH